MPCEKTSNPELDKNVKLQIENTVKQEKLLKICSFKRQILLTES
jgi:hypothetical protein